MPIPSTATFRWPEGKRAAVSLSFDDARPSQIEHGFPILQRHRVHATFYVIPAMIDRKPDGWKELHDAGHEIGNHTVSHPCSGNFEWSRSNALEDYTLERMAAELDSATASIRQRFGSTPTTFAYPCGQTYVGRGENQQSYAPLIAERFVVGRGFNTEVLASPAYCDTAMMPCRDFDRRSTAQVIDAVNEAAHSGAWLILAGHDVGKPARQTVESAVLDEVCKYLTDPANGVWIDTVARVGEYVVRQRKPQ